MIALTHYPSSLIEQCELTHLARQNIDFQLAQAQHQAYRSALCNSGIDVRVFDMNQQNADAVFVEDVAVVLDELIILGSMGAKSREPESFAWRRVLTDFRTVRQLPVGATLEGGDVLRVGRDLIIGQSCRTNAAAIEATSEIVRPLGYTVHAVPVMGCLHLKTACTALDDECLLINPNWIAASALPHKRQLVAADHWGANILRLPDRLIANSQNRATVEQLTNEGYQVDTVDLSEFAKAEAGVTCLCLII